MPNGLSLSASDGSDARSAGACRPLAACQDAAPTFCSTALRCSSMLAGTGSVLALAVGAAALGEADADADAGVGVTLGDAGAIPP